MAEVPGAGHAVAPSEALLFVITALFIGLCTQHLCRPVLRFVPYTALLLLWGLCIGLVQAVPPATKHFTETLSLWMAIDPHLLLITFLPTIGFSAGISQKPHMLRRNWAQILILAWPGVAISFLIIAICARYVFPYGWTWPQALLFGAMLSATDPVAVVAVLHEVGADAKLASVIDGESLINDGSALVAFAVLQAVVQGTALSAGQIVLLFCRLALLGAALGAVFGVATSFWLSRITREPTLQIVLTFTSAYSCYYVAEELLGASGLLAVVCNGFTASLIGGRQITKRIAVQMHAFWSSLEWAANTLLFLWCGAALGFALLPPKDPLLARDIVIAHHLSAVDAGYCVVLYLWMLVARACSIFTFYPLLSTGRVGYALSWRAALVMVWAGLRGAVGVAMSLFVLLDPLIEPPEFKAHCVFYMVCMAFTTVIINGSTTKALLTVLGLLRRTPAEVEIIAHVVEDLEGIRKDTLGRLGRDPVLGDPFPAAVRAFTCLDTAEAATLTAYRRLHRRSAFVKRAADVEAAGAEGGAARLTAAGVSFDRAQSLVVEFRKRMICMIKAFIGDQYRGFKLDTAQAQELHEVANKALDKVEEGPLATWEILRPRLERRAPTERAAALVSRLGGRSAARALSRPAAAQRLLLVSALVRAHLSANRMAHQYLGEVCGGTSQDDGGTDSRQGAKDPEVEGASQQIIAESLTAVVAARKYARDVLLPRDPALGPLLQSRLAAMHVLEEQEAFLRRIEAAGLVCGEEVQAIQGQIGERLACLLGGTQWQAPPAPPRAPWAPRAPRNAGSESASASGRRPPGARRFISVPAIALLASRSRSGAAAAANGASGAAAVAPAGGLREPSELEFDQLPVRRLRTCTASLRYRPPVPVIEEDAWSDPGKADV